MPPELGQLANLKMLKTVQQSTYQHAGRSWARLANLQRALICLTINSPVFHPFPSARQSAGWLDLRIQSTDQPATRTGSACQPANALGLDGNQLTSLPRSFARLGRLDTLALRGNPLRTPPPEIAEKGAAAVRAYLARLDDTSVVRREAKLMLVGEGGTGKSSLLFTLHCQDFDAHLSSTHGVAVLPISLPCPGPRGHQPDPERLGLRRPTDLPYHPPVLHDPPLGLSAGLEQAGENGPGRLDHWLRKIQVLAPGSPVLLVATHCDERPADINLDRFRATYPQIAGLAAVSNKTGAGIEELKAVIASEAAKLPLMEQEWPRAWVEVEAALLLADKTHINGEELAASVQAAAWTIPSSRESWAAICTTWARSFTTRMTTCCATSWCSSPIG